MSNRVSLPKDSTYTFTWLTLMRSQPPSPPLPHTPFAFSEPAPFILNPTGGQPTHPSTCGGFPPQRGTKYVHPKVPTDIPVQPLAPPSQTLSQPLRVCRPFGVSFSASAPLDHFHTKCPSPPPPPPPLLPMDASHSVIRNPPGPWTVFPTSEVLESSLPILTVMAMAGSEALLAPAVEWTPRGWKQRS